MTAVAATRPWPESVAAAAYQGLAGEVVGAIAPHTEADPVAILSQFLVAFGNVIGREAHYPVEADHHRANEYVVLVGASAKGRKGSSWSQVKRIISSIDPAWAATRIVSGLSSGEGLIWQVRDEVEAFDRRSGEKRMVADAVEDKRTMVLESEFAIVLRQLVREGNTLSAVIRNAWDSEVLQALTKNSPARATGAHISIIGHITADELIRYIDATELANGFLNRFMLFAVKRARLLPEGGSLEDVGVATLQARLQEAVAHARDAGKVSWDGCARERWHEVYPTISEGHPGMFGAVTARAEAHVVRLAMLYALLDATTTITLDHLTAALALWDYSSRSAAWVFGDSLGDPVADDIWRAMKDNPGGMSRTDIRDLFNRNRSTKVIDRALDQLAAIGRLRCETRRQNGARPVELWIPQDKP